MSHLEVAVWTAISFSAAAICIACSYDTTKPKPQSWVGVLLDAAIALLLYSAFYIGFTS